MRTDLAPARASDRAAPPSFRAVNGWRGPGALAIAIAHFSVAADFVAYRRRPAWPLPTLIEVGALALVIAWMCFSSKGLIVFAAPFVFCAFVLAFAGDRGALSRLLSTRPMMFFAELSFAIFKVHAIVLIFLLGALHGLGRLLGASLFTLVANPLAGTPGAPAKVEVLHLVNPLALWACAIVYVVAVLASAHAAYRWIEVPGRAYFGGLAKRMDTRAAGRRAPGGLARPEPTS